MTIYQFKYDKNPVKHKIISDRNLVPQKLTVGQVLKNFPSFADLKERPYLYMCRCKFRLNTHSVYTLVYTKYRLKYTYCMYQFWLNCAMRIVQFIP